MTFEKVDPTRDKKLFIFIYYMGEMSLKDLLELPLSLIVLFSFYFTLFSPSWQLVRLGCSCVLPICRSLRFFCVCTSLITALLPSLSSYYCLYVLIQKTRTPPCVCM